mmetsp:Transcript_40628/g.84565  ORF Transcript_40628/g.84565 Transcript_40628/m.84565 type:complete len:230 (+) Transcript_40628:91-780(+)
MHLLHVALLPFLSAYGLLSSAPSRLDGPRSTRLYGVDQGRRLISQGMATFRQGQVQKSIELFDGAEMEEPRFSPYLWQRGLSYYYADEFTKAQEQFRTDVKVNPLDVEEIVWDIASALRLDPTNFPVKNALSLPPNQRDRRPIMATVYKLFRGEATEAELAAAGHSTGKPSDEFYSLFYLGLFAEARQERSKAEQYLRQSVHTQYALGSGSADYMTDVARVHCQLRGWM